MSISILMSVYNEEKLIGSALKRATDKIKKYGAGAEILIGIDGNDDTERIARAYARRFGYIRVYKFAKRKGRTKTMNFLIGMAKGKILINHDPDKLLGVDLKKVELAFKPENVGALIQLDNMGRDAINDGQRVFEETYMELKLRHNLNGNKATAPAFTAYIWRKSALKKPYFETTQDDSELVYKVMKAGYDVLYIKDLAYCLPDNPRMPALTPDSIMKRRIRGELWRRHAKQLLHTDIYSAKSHSKDFIEAIFLTPGRCDTNQFLGFLEYLIIVFVAIINARFRLIFERDEADGWKMKYRVNR